MPRNAEEQRRARVGAMNDLEGYCYEMRYCNELANNLDADDKVQIEKAVHDTLDWLELNQLASTLVFEAKLKELEDVVDSIMLNAEEQRRARVGANLKSYCFTMRYTHNMKEFKENIETDDMAQFQEAVDDTLDWLDVNQLAEKDEIVAKQKALEDVVNPILDKVFNSPDGLQAEGSIQERIPEGWQVQFSVQYGIPYYWNALLGVSSWERPS